MKALTLHQPWASLVAMGVKTIETRGRPTKYRGPLAIHAGKQVQYGAVGDFYAETWFSDVTHVEAECYCDAGEVDVSCQRGATRTPCLTRLGHEAVMLPLGAIVATCELVDVVPIVGAKERIAIPWMPHVAETVNGSGLWLWKGPGPTECLSTGRPPWLHDDITDQCPYGDFTPCRFAWLLGDIKPVDPPAQCKGRQGLWPVPDGVLVQLEGAAA